MGQSVSQMNKDQVDQEIDKVEQEAEEWMVAYNKTTDDKGMIGNWSRTELKTYHSPYFFDGKALQPTTGELIALVAIEKRYEPLQRRLQALLVEKGKRAAAAKKKTGQEAPLLGMWLPHVEISFI